MKLQQAIKTLIARGRYATAQLPNGLFLFLQPCDKSDGLVRLHASRGQASPTSQEETEILLSLIDALLEEGRVVTQGPTMYPRQTLESCGGSIVCTTYVWCSRPMSDYRPLFPLEREPAPQWKRRLEAHREQVHERLAAGA